jgi:cephalosporin-C deacetylase-like acetyl esterase
MNLHGKLFRQALVLALFWPVFASAAPELTLRTETPGAVYQPNEQIIWRAEVRADLMKTIEGASYSLKQGGGKLLGAGPVAFKNGKATLRFAVQAPGTILAEVTGTNHDGRVFKALAGAAVAPDKIPVSMPCPDDFDAFWKAKIEELSGVPEHPVLQLADSHRHGVNYWKLQLDNIRCTHIQAQLARPVTGGKLPAMLVVQWAGVYPLQKEWVTQYAAQGWLTLNIMAHDLPIDEPASFYEQLSRGALTNYTAIGNDDREKSYFLRMYLSCYRAVEYLSERPDWDGRTLVVTGTSQGGLQSFVAAGLNPKVTGLMALVPAGCDDTGDLAGRSPGWPYWGANAGNHELEKVRETSRYFDGVNFAARIKCPALIGLGLIDTTSPPSGVFAAINQLQGPKEVVVMPEANHHGDNHTHLTYTKRAAAWCANWVAHKPAPLAAR